MAEKEPARGAQNGRHRLLRLDPPVDQPNPALADVAMPAWGRFLAEHGEKRLAAAAGRFAKRHEIVELHRLDALALLGRGAVEDLAPPELDVARAIKRERVGGQSVAAGAADLLIIGFDRRGHVGVKDEADVGLVDAHAEGDGRADDAIVLALKGVLGAGANVMIEPGVIGERAPAGARKFGRELLRPAPRRAIDDARFALVRVEPAEELAGRVRFRPHGQKEVRAIERAHENSGTADEQLLGDFSPRRLVRGRGHRDHLDAEKALPRPRAGANIQGGNRDPIARRNAPRRWREDRL